MGQVQDVTKEQEVRQETEPLQETYELVIRVTNLTKQEHEHAMKSMQDDKVPFINGEFVMDASQIPQYQEDVMKEMFGSDEEEED